MTCENNKAHTHYYIVVDVGKTRCLLFYDGFIVVCLLENIPANVLFHIRLIMLLPSRGSSPAARVSFRACAYNMKES